MSSHDERRLWQEARSLQELGWLMARWLEGDLSYQPGYGGDTPDSETAGIIPTLAKLNQAGLVTDQSQPGVVDAAGSQRAFVTGFAADALAEAVQTACKHTDLVVVALPPLAPPSEAQIVVTLDGEDENTWLGRCMGTDRIDSYSEELAPEALAALAAAWELQIFDPVWGRNDLLWPTLERAVQDFVTSR